MNEDQYTISSGHLDVGDGHKIYYQSWGNPKGIPIFVFHGGPGSQSRDKHKLAFDPKRHLVVFHDQRGCGQSTADDYLNKNTIDDLVGDIEKLRKKFKFEKINVFGHSWGSTLALYYAIKHPKPVKKLIIGGVFLGTKAETDHLYQGGLARLFPEAWDRFVGIVPEKYRNDTLKYYENVFKNGNQDEKIGHLRRWSQLEPAPMSIDADYKAVRQTADAIDNLDDLQSVMIGIHYFRNDCFIPEEYIMKNASKLKSTPTVIVQGRFDTVTLPQIAYELANKMGDNCHLHIVPNSHKAEGALREVQRAYAWSFFN